MQPKLKCLLQVLFKHNREMTTAAPPPPGTHVLSSSLGAQATIAEEAMQVDILKREQRQHRAGNYLEFRIRNVDNSFANGLRRVMLAEIPTLAIEHVDIRTNTSVYHDEMLAHRIGLVPWLSDRAAEFKFQRDCVCDDGCPQCEIIFELQARCAINDHSRVVSSNDFVHVQTETADIKPVTSSEEGIWLLTLGRGQEIDIRCRIRKGIAKMHARYMAVATVAMQYEMDVRLNKSGLAKLPDDVRKIWVNKCPAEVFSYDEADGAVEVAHPDRCIYCRECLTLEPPFDKLPGPLVSVRPRTNTRSRYNVVFQVESTGVLKAERIVQEAIAVLKGKLSKIRNGLDELARRDTSAPSITRPISKAPTAVQVANQEATQRPTDDDLFNLM